MPPSPPHSLSSLSPQIRNAATSILTAHSTNTPIPLLSQTLSPPLTPQIAYKISSTLTTLRQTTQDSFPIGRKIGFTNPQMWKTYNISRPNWSHMLSTSVHDISPLTTPPRIDMRGISNLQPRIEPELALCISRPLSADMSEEEILGCVEWMAPAFEIVVSVYEGGWRFAAEDTTAAGALHERLLVGKKVYVNEGNREGLLGRMEGFEVDLCCGGEIRERGVGRNALGGAVKALKFLVRLLDEQGEGNGRDGKLRVGEIVTTGTLTDALIIRDGERWSTEVRGIELEGMDVRFEI